MKKPTRRNQPSRFTMYNDQGVVRWAGKVKRRKAKTLSRIIPWASPKERHEANRRERRQVKRTLRDR